MKVMFRRWRRGLPFQPRRFPRICRGFLPMLQRPDEINQWQQVSDAENRGARARHHIVNLEFRRVGVITPGHTEITEDELREECEIEPEIHRECCELAEPL